MCAQVVASQSDVLLASYDALPYGGGAISGTRPDHLAAMAGLHGISTPDVSRCRVLDIGCAMGGNVLAMAVAMPESTFVGIDLSPRQVESARAAARSLGVENVRFEAMSVTDVGERLGRFDFIVCHGVYSWVPGEVQRAILEECARNLTPNGIAYVSYNTYPGWHSRGLVREMLLFHDLAELAPLERVQRGRELLTAIIDAVPQTDPVYASILREELELLSDATDTYFLHEELEAENNPVYFADFVRCAAAAGLQYICEANPSVVDTQLPRESRDKFRRWSRDYIQYQQYLDFARNRTFRRSLLCRAGRAVSHDISADAVPTLWLRSRCFPDPNAADAQTPGVEVFRTSEGLSVTMAHPLVRALLHVLSDARPAAVAFADLFEATRRRLTSDGTDAGDGFHAALADAVLQCALVRLVELTTMPVPCVTTLSHYPVASPMARFEARHGHQVSTLAHHTLNLSVFDRFVIQLLDGTRDADTVGHEVLDAAAGGALELGEQPSRESILHAVNYALQQFKLAGLLLA